MIIRPTEQRTWWTIIRHYRINILKYKIPIDGSIYRYQGTFMIMLCAKLLLTFPRIPIINIYVWYHIDMMYTIMHMSHWKKEIYFSIGVCDCQRILLDCLIIIVNMDEIIHCHNFNLFLDIIIYQWNNEPEDSFLALILRSYEIEII